MQADVASARWQSSRVWFVLIVGAVCLWVLSLPVFPSQDGPVHRYYAHALGAVLEHQPSFSVYALRNPFPPYATQYLSLIGLFHLFSFNMAEKLLTVTEIVCFACGLRLCATAAGPAGAWVSLLLAPLLLPWYLLMGFLNYSLGLSVALLVIGCWLRMERSRPAIVGFALCALLLVVTHPVPVLLLLCFEALDLFRRRFLMPKQAGWWKQHTKLIAGFTYTVCLAIYPSLAVDKSQAANTLGDMGFHAAFVRTALLLTGLSPYNTRSHDLLINSYRLACYALLLITLFWALRAFRASVRARQLGPAAAFSLYAVLLTLLLPFLPDHLNGGVFFATRLVILVWVFALLGAAGQAVASRDFRRLCIGLGLVLTITTLLPAEHKLREAALRVQTVEQQALPAHTRGLLLNGPTLTTAVRSSDDLAFNPYLWANMLPFVQRDDLVLDAPWLQLSVSPLRAAAGAPVISNASAMTDQPQTDPPASLQQLFPGKEAEGTVRDSQVILYAGTEHELSRGLVEYLGVRDAADFTCTRVIAWSLVCVRKSTSLQEERAKL